MSARLLGRGAKTKSCPAYNRSRRVASSTPESK
jgi:hypothetical protein